ncbi:hypothetical protein BJ165DRAFT_1523162 [Panaeolus papilionaceus]|nr:hypothetical protein BJ165DRAFT_1523162 [Panaeolus papilionaceus]
MATFGLNFMPPRLFTTTSRSESSNASQDMSDSSPAQDTRCISSNVTFSSHKNDSEEPHQASSPSALHVPSPTRTWAPSEVPETPRIEDRASSNITTGIDGDFATALPPSYEVARVPAHPVTYAFSKLGRTSGTGLLLPLADSPDTRPLYYIAVSSDFMYPNCLVTSIFKGSNADGDYVGGFTVSATPSTSNLECPSDCNDKFEGSTDKRGIFSELLLQAKRKGF